MLLKKIINSRNTLLFRLTLLYAGIFTLSVFLIFFFCYLKIYQVTMSDLDSELLGEARHYRSILNEEGVHGVKKEINEISEQEEADEEFHRLISSNGDILTSTDLSSWGKINTREILLELQQEQSGIITSTIHIEGSDHKARMISYFIDKGLVIQIGETLEDAEDYLVIFRNWFLILLFLVMVMSSLIGWFMAKRALLDMEEVTRTALEISNGDYDRRVQVKNRFDEIRRLGDTFNSMLDHIKRLLTSMKEGNANIAHDLRSPLTRIRGIAEMSLMGEKSIEEYKNMAASTIEECDRLIEIINTLLEITELESGIKEPQNDEIDLVPIIQEASELFRLPASEKSIEVNEVLPETLVCHGDRKKLQRIVSNLLDNSIKYTAIGGTVSISAAAKTNAETKQIIISVEDNGPGISADDQPKIFKRFYQCDRSRSQDGVGLGLSLAKTFAEAMHGTISVNSEEGKGSKFLVSFPQ